MRPGAFLIFCALAPLLPQRACAVEMPLPASAGNPALARAVFRHEVQLRETEEAAPDSATLRARLFKQPQPQFGDHAPVSETSRVVNLIPRAVALAPVAPQSTRLANRKPPLELPAPPSRSPQPEPAPPRAGAFQLRTDALPAGGADLALQPTTFTPYDRYLGTVRTAITNLEPREATIASVCRLMKQGHNFRYRSSDPYRPDAPAVTESRRAGDCKSKALWLYQKLGDAGALFVIGKAQKRSHTSHAWVYWRDAERWWILDCTERSDPIVAASVSTDRYVPYYSFGRGGAYRHRATRLILIGADASPAAAAVGGRAVAKNGRR